MIFWEDLFLYNCLQSAATLQMGEHKKERKKIRAEEDKIFKEELLKAKEEIRHDNDTA